MEFNGKSGIGLLIISNVVLISSFAVNLIWSNYFVGGGSPIYLDLTTSALYIIAAVLAYIGIRNSIRYKIANEKGIGQLILSFILTVLPALIVTGQIWGLIKILIY
tara:strand:+ start:161 stop:478 length:318 start_codon:yes stop_codon:yes gene_type:complete